MTFSFSQTYPGKTFDDKVAETEKVSNRKLSKVRFIVEHAVANIERSRYMKDVLCDIKDSLFDFVVIITFNLHNLRVVHSKGSTAAMTKIIFPTKSSN